MSSLSAHTATAAAVRPILAARSKTSRRAAAVAPVARCSATPSSSSADVDNNNQEQSQSHSQSQTGVVVSRRAFGMGAALFASALDASSNTAAAFERPPPGYRPYNDTIDGYKLFRPDDWIEVKGSGNDIFFRNPAAVEENMFVSISSPSSTKYATVADLGTPEDAAKKVLDQYLNEFMSTRLGVRRESSIVSATERMAEDINGDPVKFYDVKLRISSYATKNQYGLTEADRPQVLEWDRVLTSALGTANGRLYELRMQTSTDTFDTFEKTFNVVRDSFKPFEVDQSNLSFPLF